MLVRQLIFAVVAIMVSMALCANPEWVVGPLGIPFGFPTLTPAAGAVSTRAPLGACVTPEPLDSVIRVGTRVPPGECE